MSTETRSQKSGVRSQKPVRAKDRFVVDRWTAEQIILQHYIKDARQCIQHALDWRRRPSLAERPDAAKSYQDWLKWAKSAGGEAQYWAKKLGRTLGRTARGDARPTKCAVLTA